MTDRTVAHATFTLERTCKATPERVFNAWADQEVKASWFAPNVESYELDFHVGGLERLSAMAEGKQIAWEALYREIVPNERIVYTAVLYERDAVATVSLTTVELVPEDEVTRLVLVEAGAYLDGREEPAWREQGTSDWLNALGDVLATRESS
jgi:uncharacterized protein YndB with AHSA1/START domain